MTMPVNMPTSSVQGPGDSHVDLMLQDLTDIRHQVEAAGGLVDELGRIQTLIAELVAKAERRPTPPVGYSAAIDQLRAQLNSTTYSIGALSEEVVAMQDSVSAAEQALGPVVQAQDTIRQTGADTEIVAGAGE